MARQATGEVLVRERRQGRTFALRFHAYGKRRYLSLGTTDQGWTRRKAEEELSNVLTDVRRGIWRPPQRGQGRPEPASRPSTSSPPSGSAARQGEFAARTIEDYGLALSHHLLPFFAGHTLSEITAQEVDRYKAAKIREREQALVERPLSNRTINKTLTRLGQILDVAVRYELVEHNPVKTKVEKLKEAEPRRARLSGEQVQVLLEVAGRHRALLATAIMAGGLRVSELTHLRWRDLDLGAGELSSPARRPPPASVASRSSRSWSSSCASTRSPRAGANPTTSSSPVGTGAARGSGTASAPASSTPRSSARTSSSPARVSHRFPTASPSTLSGAPTPPFAPSSASTRRSPRRRWAIAIRG